MKKVRDISSTITKESLAFAAKCAFKHHKKKLQVKIFCSHFDENIEELFNALKDGTWRSFISYRELKRKSKDGKKIRHIKSPSLRTRIYQHLFLNLVYPIYQRKDNFNGVNCKPSFGITSKIRSHSLLQRTKHLFFDCRRLKYLLLIDQRKCYDHVRPSIFRKALKNILIDQWLIDFGVEICFYKGKLPIGTPTSPLVHHIVMLPFDNFVKEISSFSVRYADDNLLGFETKEEAQQAKWRIKNYWWYELKIRSKRQTVKIDEISLLDFCGYVFHRNQDKSVTDHNKGYVTIRKTIATYSNHCNNDKSWGSYFGILKHADTFSFMLQIQRKMKLKQLTNKIKLNRKLDAPTVKIDDILNQSFTLYDYEIRNSSDKEGNPNWIKCLIGIDEIVNGRKTGKKLAKSFSGNYRFLYSFLLKCEEEVGRRNFLPLEEVQIENASGYIFKESTERIYYIDESYYN